MSNRPLGGRTASGRTDGLRELLRHSLVETVAVSAVFYLVVFGLLAVTDLAELTPELVFVGLVPLLVLLVSSGRISEFRFGDVSMKFQEAVQGDISSAIGRELIKVEAEDARQKRDTNALDRMIDNQASTLVFRTGRPYSHSMVEKYLRENLAKNPEFSYVLFTDESGRFSGLMDATDFVTYVWRQADEDEDESNLIDAIQTGQVLEADGVIKARITDGSTLGEARRKLQAVDADRLVVVDHDDRFVGVLTREEVLSTLLERVTGSEAN